MEKIKQSNESLPTCKAPGLPICEPEDFHVSLIENVSYKKIEPPEPAKTLHCDSIDRLDEPDEADGEEEASAGESATTEEVVRIEQIEVELLKKKKLVDLIGERLSLNIPECPSDDSCVNMEVELQRGKVHPHVLKLMQDNHQLRQQLSQAQLSCKAIDLSLKYLRNSLCRDLKAGVMLQRRLDELNSFKLNVEHEQALCRQRYRHLQKVKYEWVDCDAYLSNSTANRELELKKFVRRSEYIQPKRDAIKLLKGAKLKAMSVHNDLTSSMAKHSHRLGSISSFRESRSVRRHHSDILTFLHRNDHLLGHETH